MPVLGFSLNFGTLDHMYYISIYVYCKIFQNCRASNLWFEKKIAQNR